MTSNQQEVRAANVPARDGNIEWLLAKVAARYDRAQADFFLAISDSADLVTIARAVEQHYVNLFSAWAVELVIFARDSSGHDTVGEYIELLRNVRAKLLRESSRWHADWPR